MSHAIVSKLKSTKITNVAALRVAAALIGMNFRVCEPKKGHYRTWKDANGGWVGDWPLPEGVSAEEMGDNADFVLSVPADKDPNGQCYELGIVYDEEDKCWYPAHDFHVGGFGLESYVGPTVTEGTTVVSSHQTLMDHYRIAVVATKQRAMGKVVEFAKQNQKLVLRIQ